MAVKLLSSSGGSVTLDVGVTASNFALTVPTANGTMITTGSSGQSIPKAALPTGSVLQVVQATLGGGVTTTSGTFVTTGLAASITPTSASSKILILVTANGCYTFTSNHEIHLTIYRGGSNIALSGSGQNAAFGWGYGANSPLGTNINISYLDSPATTSSTTYTIYMASGGGQTIGINTNNTTSFIQLLEIAA